MARMIKEGIKKRETDPASNQFLKCSPQPRTDKRFTKLCKEKKGEGGNRGDQDEMRWNQKRRKKASQ